MTDEKDKQFAEALESLKNVPGPVMMAMQKAQDIYGYLPLKVQLQIADYFDVPLATVYGIATFYSQFRLEQPGQIKIAVCLGTACYVKGSDKILEEIEKELGIKCGECTADGLFSIDSCRCVGACGLAPVMIIDGEVYGRLKPDDVKGILDKYMQD